MSEGTVLLVGTHPDLFEPVSRALDDRFDVLSATDPEGAFHRLRSARVDAVLVGERVGDDGPLPFLRETRALVGTDLPVVLSTGDASLAASAVEAGASDYVESSAVLEYPHLLVRRLENLLDGPGEHEAGLVPVPLYTATRTLPTVDRDDDAVELGLRVETDADENEDVLVRVAARAGCRLTLEGITPRPGGGGLLRLGVDGDDPEATRRAATGTPGVVVAEPTDGGGLTLLVSELGLLSHLADHGATVRSLVADPEGADVTVSLPASVDVRSFVETCRARYSGTELVARRECESPDSDAGWGARLPGGLTDRQREAVLAAHRDGYFEWPRESTGEEIADRLGVSPPTFHQHLRKGLARMLEAVVDEIPERRAER